MGNAGGLPRLVLVWSIAATVYFAVQLSSRTETHRKSEASGGALLTHIATSVDPAQSGMDVPSLPQAKDGREEEFTSFVREVLSIATRLDNDAGLDATAIDAQILDLANRLTSTDATQLQEIAKNPSRGRNSRYLAVYLMGERPEDFYTQLENVAASETELLNQKVEPHTQAELGRNFEAALRAQALGALDRLNKIDNREKAFFGRLHESHSNPLVRKLARMGAVGADQGKTLIRDYIDAEL